MKKYNIAVLGATGAVGMQILSCLKERKFPVGKLKLFTDKKESGKIITFCGKEFLTEEVQDNSFKNLDIIFGAVQAEISKIYIQKIKKSGAVYIDNSSAFRHDKDVPLVVSHINPDDIFLHNGVIANPNCSTIIALTALYPIWQESKITKIIASTYQAVSGAGKLGVEELNEQTSNLLKGKSIKSCVFPHQIAKNIIPKISEITESKFTTEELKLKYETHKILHDDSIMICATCARVPVERCHSISLNITTEKFVDLERVKSNINIKNRCILLDSPEDEIYPMPTNTSGQDMVTVGRIRRDGISKNGIALWCCGDQLRRGAATNAVEIAEVLISKWSK